MNLDQSKIAWPKRTFPTDPIDWDDCFCLFIPKDLAHIIVSKLSELEDRHDWYQETDWTNGANAILRMLGDMTCATDFINASKLQSAILLRALSNVAILPGDIVTLVNEGITNWDTATPPTVLSFVGPVYRKIDQMEDYNYTSAVALAGSGSVSPPSD